MPTEVLNDDVKDLRADVREVRVKVESVKDEAQRIALYQAELKGEFRYIKFFLGTLLAGFIGAGVEFFRLDSKVGTIETRFDKFEAKVDAHFDKVEERMNRSESQLADLKSLVSKLVDQGKAQPKP